jgi:dTDP-4-amino-4,6-dideoxygalactose transaminase
MKKMWLSSPHMGGAEIEYVKEAFDTNWIAPLGPNVESFEKQLQDYISTDSAVAVLSSGTAAIHLALILLGIESGDEVICQSFTFSGSANPIAYQHATPVFIDSEIDTWNMSPEYLEEAIKKGIQRGKKPKAIIPVHLYGMPAQMDKILNIANQYEIPVIEDAAEALGSHSHNQMCGSFGNFSVLSFNGNKIITTSGGGAIVSKNKDAVLKAKFLATQARDPAPHYQHTEIGYNYRMSNVCAGIGRGQMEVLEERIYQRRGNYEFYKKQLSEFPGISFLDEMPGNFSNRWLTCILVDPKLTNGVTREDIRIKLESFNIESRPLWKPMHLQPVFKNAPYFGDEVAESLFKNGLCLPSGSNLSVEDLQRVIDCIKLCLSNR